MDIDFIKWKVGYAMGFKIEGNFVSVLSPDALWEFITLENDEILKPFLNQRAIEGINNDGNHWIIEQRECGSYILGHEEIDTSGDSYDISKEKALAYIYNQEKL